MMQRKNIKESKVCIETERLLLRPFQEGEPDASMLIRREIPYTKIHINMPF